ncbi:hypothetical protein JCM15060_05830 [Halanaerobaculum tunisiense]
MWHIDITYVPVKDKHVYLISALDCYSCYIVHSKRSFTMTTDDMKDFMSKALFKADLFEVPDDEKTTLISDNGTQLVSIRTAVRHPETNGKIEVFHKTIKHENIYVKPKYESFYEVQEDIINFIEYYNNSHLHQSIDFVTLYDKCKDKANEIIQERKNNH